MQAITRSLRTGVRPRRAFTLGTLTRGVVVLCFACAFGLYVAAAASAAESTGAISGKVTGASSKAPIAGIEVCATETSLPVESMEYCATTGAGGEYTIAGLPSGSYGVGFFSPDYGDLDYIRQFWDGKDSEVQAESIAVEAGRTISGVDAVMQTGGQIAGKVTSSTTKAPIAGIDVCAYTTGENEFYDQCAQTNANGEYTVAGLGGGSYYVYFFDSDNSALNYLAQDYDDESPSQEAVAVAVSAGSTTPAIDAALSPGGRITGKVTSASSKAGLAEIAVCPSGVDFGTSAGCATTNSSGEYSIGGLASGEYRVEFYSSPGANYITQYYNGTESYLEASIVSVAAGSTTAEINAAMVTGGEITGKAVSETTKSALADIEVCATAIVTANRGCAVTDGTGEYTILGLAAGEYTIEFSPTDGQDYAPQAYGEKGSTGEVEPVQVTLGAITHGVDATMAPGGEIRGKVTNAASKAVLAGVQACLWTPSGGYEGRCATTDSAGEYAITGLATGEYKVGFQASNGAFFTQYYEDQESLSEGAAVTVSAGGVTAAINAALTEGGHITGKVTTAASHAGLAGVQVCAETEGESFFGPCTETNSAGEYAIDGLSTARYSVKFEASGGNYLPQYYNDRASASQADLVSVAAGTTASEINAALATAGTLAGKVTATATKAAISGIVVCAEPKSEDPVEKCANTNTAGEYTIVGLPSGKYAVRFAAPGGGTLNYVSQYYSAAASPAAAKLVSVTAGSNTEGIDAAMTVGAQIAGKVLAASDKAALDGIEVCAYPLDPEVESRCASTDTAGEYTLSSLATGEYTVAFLGPYSNNGQEYVEQYYQGKASMSEADPVKASAGATTAGIDATLVATGEITGKVTSASSKADLAGIEACPLSASGGYDGQCATTNAGGEYKLIGLSTGEYKIQFSAPYDSALNYLPQYYNNQTSLSGASTVSVSVGAVSGGIDAAMLAGGEITGRVTNASTKAGLGGVEVCPQAISGGISSTSCTTSNAGGAYKLVGLVTGEYRIEFRSYSGDYVTQYYNTKPSSTEANPVQVTAGSTTPAINAAMTVGGKIAGKVTDAATQGRLANIQVCSSPVSGDSEDRCAVTNANGEYTITGLATGAYKVEFSVSYGSTLNYVPQYYDDRETSEAAKPVPVTAGLTATEINAAMAAGGKITGKVTDAVTRTGLLDVYVCLELPKSSFFSDCADTNAAGEYAFPGLPTGEYKVEFEAFDSDYSTQYYNDKGSAGEAESVSVTAGSTTANVNAAMVVGGQITGTVFSASTKAGIDGIQVCATSRGTEDFVRCGSTGSDGEYTIDGLAGGEYSVEFESSGQNYIGQYYNDKGTSTEAEPVSVTYGSSTTGIDAGLAVGGEITGKVTNASSAAPLAGITVCAQATAGGSGEQCASSSSGGEYAIVGLATGEYKLDFYPGTSANYVAQYYHDAESYTEAQAVTVTAGSTTSGIDAAMTVGGQITGKVTNASTKAAVDGVEICPRAAHAETFFLQCATTNPAGEYTLVGLATGEYKLEFSAAGQNYLPQYYGGEASEAEASVVSVTAGSTTPTIDAAMVVGGEISGKVLEASTKSAVADIEVCAAPVADSGFFEHCAFTDDNGEYTILALSGGEYDVRFSSPSDGYAEQYYKTKTALAFAEPVAVTTGEATGDIGAELANLPLSIGAPQIAGAAKQGETLSEVHGSWANDPTEYTYQWELCDSTGQGCGAIANATGQTYVPTLADVGHTLRVAETAVNLAGAGSPAVSAVTAVVLPLPPANVSPPSIAGVAQQGKTLSESHGEWENDPTEYSYQWLRCTSTATECSTIAGASSQSYVPVAADVGHELEVQETARNAGGASKPATSGASAVVVPPIPLNTGLPTISGSTQQGQTLSEHHGTWEYSPTGYEYQWERCGAGGNECEALAGATEQTYTLSAADVGHTIRVQELASNAGGTSSPAVSAASAKVSAAIPVNSEPPSISGTAQQGQTLTETHGQWTNEPTGYEYQWWRCDAEGKNCAAIAGASGQTYLLGAADVGHTIEVGETARNAAGAGTAVTSEPTAAVLPAIPVIVSAPQIAGVVRQGATLTEQHGAWTNSPTGYEYQWLQCSAMGTTCLPIAGATGQTYVPDAADVGHTLEVQEVAANAGGASEPALSAATAVVLASAPTSTASPTIVGDAALHQALVLQRGAWTNEPTSYEDQWLRCEATGANCQPIAGAVDPAYVTTDADVGHAIAVREVAVNGGGPSAPVSSAATSPIVAPPLQASAGETLQATVGEPVVLDASGSSPAAEISGYSWSFGDGSHGSGSVIAHAYQQPGTYTATITVHRGAEAAEQHVSVAVTPAQAHNLTVKTQDADGAPLAGVEVLYIGPSGSRIEGVSDASGVATLAGVPDGAQTFYAWASGYQPAVGHADIAEGAGEATVTLSSGALAASTLKSHEMTLKEIEAAGIDTSDPANQRVFEFEVRLAFVESAEPAREITHCYINAEGHFVGSCVASGGPGSYCTTDSCYWSWGASGGGGGGSSEGGGANDGCCEVVAVPKIVEGHPLIQWLILRGKATILKQLFAVTMVTQNLSPEPFKLTKGSATLNLPPGLSLAPTAAPQSLEQPVPDIPGMGSATTEWVVRGDEEGEYNLSADYHGTLEPFAAPVEVQAALASPLKVWGADALSLSVKADNSALVEGVPYHVRVAITNKAEVPLYNVDLAIEEDVHANFVFQPDQSFHDDITELKPGQSLTSNEYILVPDAASVSKFNPSLSSATFDGQEVHPGEGIEAVPPPPVYSVSALHDAKGEVHLRWQPVPGAEGYEIFYTRNLETAFPAQPAEVAASAGASTRVRTLPANATEAYLTGPGDWYYAVSALIDGRPTLASRVIEAAPENEEVAGTSYEDRPWPAGGYGYQFKNAAMETYAQAAHLAPDDILEPVELENVFTDLRSNAVLSGELKKALAPYKGPLFEKLWEVMNGGVCYGLALSAGRFDDLSEPLYDPPHGRLEPEWQLAGTGPSASTLLPAPGTGEEGYNVELLRLITDDYESQLSVEALESRDAQWQAYADPHHGFQAFAEQLEAVMGHGQDLYDSSGRLSSAGAGGFAIVELFRPGDGHALLAYSAETLADGTIKIDVADSNVPKHPHAPGEPQHIFVKPDGKWSYTEKTAFPKEYALSAPGEHIDVHPLYEPTGLHLYPTSGGIADVGAETTVAAATDGNGEEALSGAIVGSGQSYDGELVRFTTPEGHLDVGGQSPNVDVRGPSVFLGVRAEAAGTPFTETENTERGVLSTSRNATLEVGRANVLASAQTADQLAVGAAGEVTGARQGAGPVTVRITFGSKGEAHTAELTATAQAPGQTVSFSAEQVAAAEATAEKGGGEEAKTTTPGGETGKTETQEPSTPAGGNAAAGGASAGGTASTVAGGGAHGGVQAFKASSTVTARVSGAIATRSGAAYVPLHCSATAGSCVPATLKLVVQERLSGGRVTGVAAASRTRTRVLVVGSATATLRAGQSETVEVALNPAGRRLIAGRGKLPALLEVVAQGRTLDTEDIQIAPAGRARHTQH
jgi:PKD domain/Carboxypeptidase regulatory-like domain